MKLKRILGWVICIILQIIVAFLLVFLTSMLFPAQAKFTVILLIPILLSVWLSDAIGISLVGIGALKFLHISPGRIRPRLFLCFGLTLLPLIVLIFMTMNSRFTKVDLQRELTATMGTQVSTQLALLLGLVGFHLPGLLKKKA